MIQSRIIGLVSLFIVATTLLSAVSILGIAAETQAQPPMNGLKFDEDGRLVPSAFDKVKTFETDENGKIKQPSVVYYVCVTTGNDANDGKSIETPFKSVRKTMSLLAPGVAVRILPGEYDETLFESGKHGTKEQPIWIGGYDPTGKRKRPLMKSSRGFLHSSNCSYMIIHDMEITTPRFPGEDKYRTGIHCMNMSESHYLVYRNLYVHHAHDSPFKFAGVYNYWLFDCEVSHDQQGLRGSGAIDNVGCHNNIVGYNYIHSGIGIGIVYKGGSANNDIHHNLIVNPGMTAITMGQSTGQPFFRPPLTDDRTTYEAKNIRAYSNIIIGGSSSFQMGNSRDCYFVNNTVIHPQRWIFRILNNDPNDELKLANFGNPHDNTIANNIFYYRTPLGGELLNTSSTIKPADKKSIIIRDNIFFDVANPRQSRVSHNDDEFGMSNNHFVDPLFNDPANPPLTEEGLKAITPSSISNKYTLKDRSPAIGIGTNYPFVKEDHTGSAFANPRSLGAIERKAVRQ